MDRLVSKLKRTLRKHLPGAKVALQRTGRNSSGKVFGEVLWDGFRAMPTRKRVEHVYDLIKEGLTADEQAQVSTILTFTPKEDAIMREEAARF